MNDRDQIAKADFDAALAEFEIELKTLGDDLTAKLHQMEANLIAAFRSYD
jgi:hypothetical protein